MANPRGVADAMLTFLDEVDPNAKVALLLNAGELATMHLALELVQEGLEKKGETIPAGGCLETLRGKIERLLVQGGYGGDPRHRG